MRVIIRRPHDERARFPSRVEKELALPLHRRGRRSPVFREPGDTCRKRRRPRLDRRPPRAVVFHVARSSRRRRQHRSSEAHACPLGPLRKPGLLPDRHLFARLLIQACPLSAFFASPLGGLGRRPRPWYPVAPPALRPTPPAPDPAPLKTRRRSDRLGSSPSRSPPPSPTPPFEPQPAAARNDSVRRRRRRRLRHRRRRLLRRRRRRHPGRRPPRGGRHKYSMSRTSARKTK